MANTIDDSALEGYTIPGLSLAELEAEEILKATLNSETGWKVVVPLQSYSKLVLKEKSSKPTGKFLITHSTKNYDHIKVVFGDGFLSQAILDEAGLTHAKYLLDHHHFVAESKQRLNFDDEQLKKLFYTFLKSDSRQKSDEAADSIREKYPIGSSTIKYLHYYLQNPQVLCKWSFNQKFTLGKLGSQNAEVLNWVFKALADGQLFQLEQLIQTLLHKQIEVVAKQSEELQKYRCIVFGAYTDGEKPYITQARRYLT
eukprot:Awhi_evm1s1265